MTEKDQRKKDVIKAMRATQDAAEDIASDLEVLINEDRLQVSPRCCELLGELRDLAADISAQIDGRDYDPEAFDGEAFYDFEEEK